MAGIDVRLPWDSQPQGVAPPNLEGWPFASLWRDARLAAFAHASWVNLADGTVAKTPSVVGTIAVDASQIGLAQRTALLGRHGRGYAGPTSSLTSFTVCAWVVFTSTVAGVEVITGNDADNTGGFRLQRNGGTNLELTHIGIANQTIASGVLQNNVPYFIAVSRDQATNTNHYAVRNLATGGVVSGSIADANGWVTPTAGVWPVGYGRSTTESVGGQISGAFISGYVSSLADVRELAANPWQLFAPRSIWVPVSTSGGGGTDLTIQDAAHGHTADSPALTLDATLAIADALHAHTADNLSLTVSGATDLTIADATHGHTADSPALTLGYVDLTIADALHGHSADNLTITGDGLVAETTRRHAGGYKLRKGYLIKGRRYFLSDDELAVHIAHMLQEVSRGDVKEITSGKPKVISRRTWDAIKPLERLTALSDMLATDLIAEDDDEETLLMFM